LGHAGLAGDVAHGQPQAPPGPPDGVPESVRDSVSSVLAHDEESCRYESIGPPNRRLVGKLV
jgi:hypothetical protein